MAEVRLPLSPSQVATLTALHTQEKLAATARQSYTLAIAEGAGLSAEAAPLSITDGALVFAVPEPVPPNPEE